MLDLLMDFLICSPLEVIWVQRMLFSSIKFRNWFFKVSTLSFLMITVLTTLFLVKLFLTNLDFWSVALFIRDLSSCNLALSLMFSCSSAEVKCCLTETNLDWTVSSLVLKVLFSFYWREISCFLLVISLWSSGSSCSTTSSGISTWVT